MKTVELINLPTIEKYVLFIVRKWISYSEIIISFSKNFMRIKIAFLLTLCLCIHVSYTPAYIIVWGLSETQHFLYSVCLCKIWTVVGYSLWFRWRLISRVHFTHLLYVSWGGLLQPILLKLPFGKMSIKTKSAKTSYKIAN